MEKLFKHPKIIIGVIIVITVFFGLQIPRVELDSNNMRFVPVDNPARIISNYIDETFGSQVIILIGLERPYKTVFEREFLAKIQEFSQEAEMVELVKDINSIMSTQYITGDSDTIIVSDLVDEDFSGTEEEITELRRRIASWEIFQGTLVSDDLSATQIIVTLTVITEDSARPEVTQTLRKIRALAQEKFSGMAQVYVTGQPVINATINESIINDNLLLIPLIVIVLLVVLFISFRSFTFVILPLLTVGIAVIWTTGAAALFGIKLSILTTVMSVILLAVGSAYGIHVVTHYMKDSKNVLDVDEHRAIIFNLMRKLIKPVFLAALTTFAGFVSFCFTPIVPIREFGFCASIGVAVAFGVAVTFIPAMLLIRGPKALKQKEQNKDDRFSRVITTAFLGIAEKKYTVLVLFILAACIMAYGLSKVIVDNVYVEYFRNETDISRSDRFIRQFFGGTKELNIVIEADTTEELLHPDVLQAVDNLSVFLTERIPATGKVAGFTDIIKRINQVFNVGESPDGLSPAGSSISGSVPVESYNEPDTFGFDSAPVDSLQDAGDFGFGDFGYNDFGFSDFGYSDNVTAERPKYDSHDLSQYTAEDIIKFLDTAAGKSPNLSGTGLVKELKRLTNYEGMAYYEIPSDPRRYGKNTPEELQQLISNYLILLAGGDDSGYSNDPLEPTVIRTMIQLRTTGNKDTQVAIDTINGYIAANFPKNVRVKMGGGATIDRAVTNLIVNSSVISVVLSVILVFLIVAISNKSLIAGVIGAVPLSLAILCNFAVMGFTGIKLSMATALIGSLAVGIGIDYTIHLIEFFNLEYNTEKKNFLRRTFMGCGKAIIVNALSVGAGFGVLAFSQFKIVAEFGLLIALCMLITALISLTLIPVLLMVIKPKFIYGAHPDTAAE